MISTFIISISQVCCQSFYDFFGSSYNETQMAGGPIYIELIINNDNTVSGFLDADPYPGQNAFCGAGEITGYINQNQVSFSFASMDPDPGCGFDIGWEIEYECIVSPAFSTMIGNYTIYENGVFHSEGNIYLRTENECADITLLEADYQSKIGDPEELYSKQYLCLAEKTCLENNLNGENGWAANFVKYMFDYMGTHNQGNTGLDFDCFSFTTNEACFSATGLHHYWIELRPAFFNYCKFVENQTGIDRWTSDHENFITYAIDACFDEQIINEETCSNLPQSLCAVYLVAAKESTKWLVRKLRDDAQAYCQNQMNNGTIYDLADMIPPPLTSNELFSNELSILTEISITNDSFFLAVGGSYQLTSIINDGSGTDVTTASAGTEYFLNVDNSIASISANGLLTIFSTNMPLINSRQPFYVYAKNGNKIGIGQFSIYDIDSDGDLLVDSYEEKINLSPNFNNGLYSDIDSDGLVDFFEALIRTDPWSNDSDFDSFSDPFEVTVRTDPLDPNSTPVSIATGIPLIDFLDSKIDIYPNPFDDMVNICFSHDLNGFNFNDLSVFDANGKLIYQESHDGIEKENYTVKMNNVPHGVYSIRLTVENQIVTKTIIKK